MNSYAYLSDAFKISVNRASTQLSSVIVVALLGAVSTHLLASFSLALSAAAIYFIAATAMQLGVQAELSKQLGRAGMNSVFNAFYASLWFVLLVSFLAILLANFFSNPFERLNTSPIGTEAFEAYKVLLWTLPIFSAYTAIHFLLESTNNYMVVFRGKLVQVAFHVFIVCAVMFCKGSDVRARDVAFAYLLADIFALFLFLLIACVRLNSRLSWLAAWNSRNPWRHREFYVEIFRQGFPAAAGAVAQKYLFHCMSIYCAALGAVYASAFSILGSMLFVLQIPVVGLTNLTTIKLSRAVGAGEFSKSQSWWVIAKSSFAMYVAVIGLSGLAALPLLAGLFTHDAIVVDKISGLGFLFLAFYLMNCFMGWVLGLLRALSDSIFPQLVVNFSLFALIVPFLRYEGSLDFNEIIALFCAVGLSLVVAMAYRCKVRLNGVTSLILRPST